MTRPDLSNDLIHFIKGDTIEESYSVLKKILDSGRLLEGTGHIKGCFPCVCFSETPPKCWVDSDALGNKVRYQPLGILVPKPWIFQKGGRPVIYGTADEFDSLPNQFKWRHVRYDPVGDPPVDFTWEREWRIQIDELRIESEVVRVVVPNKTWAERVKRDFEEENFYRAYQYTAVIGSAAWAYCEDFRWQPEILRNDPR